MVVIDMGIVVVWVYQRVSLWRAKAQRQERRVRRAEIALRNEECSWVGTAVVV